MTGRFSKHSSNRFQTRYSNKSNKDNGGEQDHEQEIRIIDDMNMIESPGLNYMDRPLNHMLPDNETASFTFDGNPDNRFIFKTEESPNRNKLYQQSVKSKISEKAVSSK